jgi:hypothetical protein
MSLHTRTSCLDPGKAEHCASIDPILRWDADMLPLLQILYYPKLTSPIQS